MIINFENIIRIFEKTKLASITLWNFVTGIASARQQAQKRFEEFEPITKYELRLAWFSGRSKSVQFFQKFFYYIFLEKLKPKNYVQWSKLKGK